MRTGEDIICKAPITEMLLYNIEKFLLPSVIKNAKNLHCPTIYANTIDNIKDTAGAVGTGASCGITFSIMCTIISSNIIQAKMG
mgnify:CR=1 FL=1